MIWGTSLVPSLSLTVRFQAGEGSAVSKCDKGGEEADCGVKQDIGPRLQPQGEEADCGVKQDVSPSLQPQIDEAKHQVWVIQLFHITLEERRP